MDKGKIMKNIENKERRNPLRKMMEILKELNERKIINCLNIMPSDINDTIDYIHVSFKIPKKKIKS